MKHIYTHSAWFFLAPIYINDQDQIIARGPISDAWFDFISPCVTLWVWLREALFLWGTVDPVWGRRKLPHPIELREGS